MLTRMTEQDWAVVLKIFRAACSQQGDKGRDDRKFLEALHYFTVYNITWRALPSEFGRWNSVWRECSEIGGVRRLPGRPSSISSTLRIPPSARVSTSCNTSALSALL